MRTCIRCELWMHYWYFIGVFLCNYCEKYRVFTVINYHFCREITLFFRFIVLHSLGKTQGFH